MLVVACGASSDHTPHGVCTQAAPNFAALAGLRIGPGFNRAVGERVGGVKGCTHLRELLGQMATVVVPDPLSGLRSAGAGGGRAACRGRRGAAVAPADPGRLRYGARLVWVAPLLAGVLALRAARRPTREVDAAPRTT